MAERLDGWLRRQRTRSPKAPDRVSHRLAAALTVGVCLSGSAGAQRTPAFRVETRLIVLQATVTNRHGELVTNLRQEAFTVYENGRRQPITVFRRDDVPVSLGLVIDNSHSMRRVRARVESAALDFVRAANPLDEVFVLDFADTAHVDVPMTRDLAALEAGISRVGAIGGTALRDAVVAAERYQRQHASRDRRVLLVITDGNDNASTAPDTPRPTGEESEPVVFAIGLFGDEDSPSARRGRHELDELTVRTGGVAYYPRSIEEVDSVVLDIAHQVRNRYTIAYAPLDQALDGTYRTIRLEVAASRRLSVRTRSGYWATRAP